MKLQVLGCYGGATQHHRVTSFLINDHILLDAGSAPGGLTLEQQRRITAAIISHSHLDHCAGIVFLTDNIFADGNRPLRIIATAQTAQAIQKHLLNGTMWPDFTEITGANSSVAIMETLEISEPKAVEELVVTPFRVRHTVPTVGFVVSDSNSAILYSADTRDILAVVEQAERTSGLKLAIVEASFPNELKQWAHKTGHLVPSDLVPLVSALGNDVPMRLFHMKPRYVDEIARDAAKLSGDVALLAQDEVVRI